MLAGAPEGALRPLGGMGGGKVIAGLRVVFSRLLEFQGAVEVRLGSFYQAFRLYG